MRALKIFRIEIPFYRYVDDRAMAVPHTQLSRLLDIFNISFHLRIQFIIEIRGDRLNFLDVIINNNNIIEFD